MKKLLLIFGLVVCSACSSTRIFYNNLDWIIESRADDYLDLGDENEKFVEAQVDAFLLQHRQKLLPKYAYVLKTFSSDLEARAIERARLQLMIADIEKLVDQTLKMGIPYALKVLFVMTPEEMQAYDKNFKRVTEEIREDISEESIEERLRDGVKRNKRVWRFFIGKPKPAQMEIIKAYSRTWPMQRYQYWLDFRLKQHKRLQDLLAASPRNPEKIEAFIKVWMLNPHQLRAKDYEEITQAFRRNFHEYLWNMLSSLSREQRLRAAKELSELAEDLLELSKED